MTHLGVSVSDERDQLVVPNLESLIKHLRDQEAAGWLAVDDAAAVELLEYPEEHRAVGRDVVAGVGRLGVELRVTGVIKVHIEGEDVLSLEPVQVDLARRQVDTLPVVNRT